MQDNKEWMTEHLPVSVIQVLESFDSEQIIAVMYSGGIDSTVMCALLKSLGHTVIPLYFNDDSQYWHTRRKIAITRSLQALDLFHIAHELRCYEYEKMRITSDTFGLIPGLKMIMQLQIMAWCQRYNVKTIVSGYNHENIDYPYTFKDELPHVIDEISDIYNRTYDTKTRMVHPFLSLDKREIIQLNEHLEFKATLKNTYSCKDTRHGGLVHCGECWGCWSRSSSFKIAKIADPTIYAHTPKKPDTFTVASQGAVQIKRSKIK
jgi:7-cyano-7-deazaguanine synthase in queuosine biosynthesis